jgi:hypothetical protein
MEGPGVGVGLGEGGAGSYSSTWDVHTVCPQRKVVGTSNTASHTGQANKARYSAKAGGLSIISSSESSGWSVSAREVGRVISEATRVFVV